MGELVPINAVWTQKAPEEEKQIAEFIGREGLPLWRLMRTLINQIITNINMGQAFRLLPTDVKTADYTAAIGEAVLVDTAGGGTVTVTFPTMTDDNAGQFVGVVRLSSLGTVNITSASDIDGLGTFFSLPLQAGLYLYLSEGT